MTPEITTAFQEIIPARASIADVRARALELVDQGDVRNALNLTVRCLCPDKVNFDLANAEYVEVDWDAQDGEDPMIQEIINQALALSRMEPVEIRKGIVALLAPPTEDDDDMRPHADVPLSGAEDASFSPEAHRATLIEAHITRNPALPSEVKIWLLALIERRRDLFTDPATARLHVSYEPYGEYAPGKRAPVVTISYTTSHGDQRSTSFREAHLQSA